MSSYLHVITKIETTLISIGALSAISLVVYETVVRFIAPQYLFDWGAEVTIYLIAWCVMLSLPGLVERNEHVQADLLIDRLKDHSREVLALFSYALGSVFCAVVLYSGYQVTSFAHLLNEESDSSLQFPMWCFYIVIPIGYGLSSLHYLLLFIKQAKTIFVISHKENHS
ncbi:TRAP transporter small permease [Xanthomarina gelatinilytica]|uniref:TRAP transporter small permease n=1 Tax=Xanthomarina gelatinilytica TaxID=1137281 RepID=UPI003AA83F7B